MITNKSIAWMKTHQPMLRNGVNWARHITNTRQDNNQRATLRMRTYITYDYDGIIYPADDTYIEQFEDGITWRFIYVMEQQQKSD